VSPGRRELPPVTGAHYVAFADPSGGSADSMTLAIAQPTSNPAAKAVANGDAELGITAISEILPYAGAEMVGPLPAEIQFYSVSTGAVAANSKVGEAARAVIRFLTTPAASAVFTARGLEAG
jgi:molybdate transport system substrate-binding protein